MPLKDRLWHPLTQSSQVSLFLVAVSSVQLLVPPYFIFIAHIEYSYTRQVNDFVVVFDTRLSVNCSRKQSTKSLIDGCANSLTTPTNCNLPVSIYLIPSWLRGSGRQHCQVVRVPDMKSKGHRFMTLPDHQLELFRGGSVQLLSYACF